MGGATATSREEVNSDDLVFTARLGGFANPAARVAADW
jgi:hypothetical protein